MLIYTHMHTHLHKSTAPPTQPPPSPALPHALAQPSHVRGLNEIGSTILAHVLLAPPLIGAGGARGRRMRCITTFRLTTSGLAAGGVFDTLNVGLPPPPNSADPNLQRNNVWNVH